MKPGASSYKVTKYIESVQNGEAVPFSKII